MNKFKAFWLKLWHHLKKFPIFMTIGIFLPVTIYFGRYLFTLNNYYFNLDYDGERVPVKESEFGITKINPLFKILDISTTSNYQGAACYQNFYALCSNNFECILIYDMSSGKLAHKFYTDMTNTEYHCNTCFFGPRFYASTDKFPLLYISMENEGVESTIAVRLNINNTYNQVEIVQTLHFMVDKGDHLWYPNSYYDYDSEIIYYSGYTKKSYMKSNDNILRYYSFPIPDHRIQDVYLSTSEALETFDLPSETATQGGFISNHFLYQAFSFNSSTDPLRMPKFRLVDLEKHEIVYHEDNLGAINGQYDEFENITICSDGKLYGFGIRSLKIFEFEYKGHLSVQ